MDRHELIATILSRYRYDPETGLITNIHGKVLGSRTKIYPELFVCGKTFRIHQLAYILMCWEYPEQGKEIDHINGDRYDNRWVNLRLVNKSTNLLNSYRMRSDREHGVYFENHAQKWVSQIRINGRTHRKRFLNKEDAIQYRQQFNTNLKGNYLGTNCTYIRIYSRSTTCS